VGTISRRTGGSSAVRGSVDLCEFVDERGCEKAILEYSPECLDEAVRGHSESDEDLFVGCSAVGCPDMCELDDRVGVTVPGMPVVGSSAKALAALSQLPVSGYVFVRCARWVGCPWRGCAAVQWRELVRGVLSHA
jgi:hypothetical protein